MRHKCIVIDPILFLITFLIIKTIRELVGSNKLKLFSFLEYSMKCSQKASYIVWKQCLRISVFGCISNRNFGQNWKLEPNQNRNQNSYRNRNFGQNRNRKFPITTEKHFKIGNPLIILILLYWMKPFMIPFLE